MELAELKERLSEWALYVDAGQQAPLGDWRIWLFLGGRGAGKTRAGAEWIRERIAAGARRIALIGPTFNDVREVMIEGPSGLKSIGPRLDRPAYESSRKRLVFPGGAVAYAFSSEDPDGLRGPQFDAAWGDEFAAWAHPQKTLDTLAMGLRLGADPRLVLTTTPRPIPALKRLVGQAGVALTRRTMTQNADNLAPGFAAAMAAAYGGSALGRQELEGALIEDPPGALWRREQIEAAQLVSGTAPALAELDRIVVAVDPPATSGPRSDECGIIIAGAQGQGADRRAIVLADKSFGPAAPAAWAEIAARAHAEFQADAVIAEANQGGEMVREVLRAAADTAGAELPVRLVRASRGKRARAEPVAALYAAGRVRHAVRCPALEDQMCAFGAPDGPRTSPDRVDALVWAIAALMLHAPPAPRLRRL